MEIKTSEKIIFEKSDIVEGAVDPIPTFKGNQIIGYNRPGDIQAQAPQLENITKPIQSPNFKSGTTGWRLNSNGILEAYNAVIT